MQRPTDGDVPLVGQRHGREDGAAEGDVVQRVDDEGERVDEDLACPLECPVIQRKDAVVNLLVGSLLGTIEQNLLQPF